MMALAVNISTYFYTTGGTYENQEPFVEWAEYLSSTTSIPYVHSVSYDDQEYSLDLAYMTRLNTEFQKLGARGISLLFAAGDDGIAGFDARFNDTFCNQSNPVFPSSSPYVTSVGGTQFSGSPYEICMQSQPIPGGLQFQCGHDALSFTEVVSSIATGSRITSGGGFSNAFSMPSYQSTLVQEYLSKVSGLFPQSFYNKNGRAYPDISAAAHNYLVYIGGIVFSVDGTSASTPVVSALISLMNDARMNLGMPPLGFLNQWLYQSYYANPEAFNDIVMGNNSCTANPYVCCPLGFPATTRYDSVSGLGTLNFLTLRNIALNPNTLYPDAIYMPPETSDRIFKREFSFIGTIVSLGLLVVVIVALIIFAFRSSQRSQYQAIN